jgi:hypothetical protein
MPEQPALPEGDAALPDSGREDPRFAGPIVVEEDEDESKEDDDDEEGEDEEEEEEDKHTPRGVQEHYRQYSRESLLVKSEVNFDDEAQVRDVLQKARPGIQAHMQRLARRSSRVVKVKVGRPKHTTTHLSYQTRMLFTWQVFLTTKGTILSDRTIMWYLFTIACMALGSGIVASLVVADPHKLSTSTLFHIIDYVKLFLAFMLGLYMSHCVVRWWNSVSSIVDFFHCIKTLVFFCNALDVPTATRDTIERLSIMSCYLLELEISSFYTTDDDKATRWLGVKEFLFHEGLASFAELELLDKVDDGERALCVWMWIGILVGSLDVAPPLKTTAVKYGHDAIDRIKSVKFYVTMQLPFMYSHMLSLLVHANNVALAIASGIAIAVLVFEATHQADLDRLSKVYRAVQGIGVSIVAMMMQPAVYEAFLTVGALLADPFTNETHGLPMLDYVQDLRRQIGEMNRLATCDAEWLVENSPGPEMHAAKSPGALTVINAIMELRKQREEAAAKNPGKLVTVGHEHVPDSA